jgi:hypothetical protein
MYVSLLLGASVTFTECERDVLTSKIVADAPTPKVTSTEVAFPARESSKGFSALSPAARTMCRFWTA